jgi:hypothetical protein
MAAYPIVWEHLVVYLEADARQHAAFLREKWPGQKFPRYAAQALMPQLDAYGQQGWELVSIQPVVVGSNGDILIDDRTEGMAGVWTSTYLCVFKRPK